MENIKIFTDEIDGTEFVIITLGENETVSMPKSYWDELQAQKELGGTL